MLLKWYTVWRSIVYDVRSFWLLTESFLPERLNVHSCCGLEGRGVDRTRKSCNNTSDISTCISFAGDWQAADGGRSVELPFRVPAREPVCKRATVSVESAAQYTARETCWWRRHLRHRLARRPRQVSVIIITDNIITNVLVTWTFCCVRIFRHDS